MGYEATIVADSVAPSGVRLTTMTLKYPRYIHAQMLTHRWFSRNAASNRARPINKIVTEVTEDPVMPIEWGANGKGMTAHGTIDNIADAKATWLRGRDAAVAAVMGLADCGVHKQIVNRVLEPYQWITAIYTGTEAAWKHFWGLRCTDDAQPEIAKIAFLSLQIADDNPTLAIARGEFHLPFVTDEERAQHGPIRSAKLSTARCARVSYLQHNGTHDPERDFALYERLVADQHNSPLEHAARAETSMVTSRNFNGWTQFRDLVESGRA